MSLHREIWWTVGAGVSELLLREPRPAVCPLSAWADYPEEMEFSAMMYDIVRIARAS